MVLLVFFFFVSAWFNCFCTSTAVEMTSTSLTAGPEPDCSAGVADVHARDITPELFTKALCAPARHKDLDVLATFQTAFNKGDKAAILWESWSGWLSLVFIPK